MSKPIFVATHPRACSTAFERVFMTRRDTLQCVHEPFGDAYYFGPERLAERYELDEKARADSGFSESTYATIMDRINGENTEGKRILIKDMAQYFMPPDEKPVSIAPSLLAKKRGVGTADSSASAASASGGCTGSSFRTSAEVLAEDTTAVDQAPYSTPTERGNPTVVPKALLGQFHFAFLIRHPSRSIPSYYRCCMPPLDDMTGFHDFRSDEAGYVELVRLFDYLRSVGIIGPDHATAKHQSSEHAPNGSIANGHTNGHTNGYTNGLANGHAHGAANNKELSARVQICVIDADDLLNQPQRVIEAFCESVGIEYDPAMLTWDSEEEHQFARDTFEKWKGFHEDAINSKDLKARSTPKSGESGESAYDEWVAKYGQKGADHIQKTVDENIKHYEYLKQYCIKV